MGKTARFKVSELSTLFPSLIQYFLNFVDFIMEFDFNMQG